MTSDLESTRPTPLLNTPSAVLLSSSSRFATVGLSEEDVPANLPENAHPSAVTRRFFPGTATTTRVNGGVTAVSPAATKSKKSDNGEGKAKPQTSAEMLVDSAWQVSLGATAPPPRRVSERSGTPAAGRGVTSGAGTKVFEGGATGAPPPNLESLTPRWTAESKLSSFSDTSSGSESDRYSRGSSGGNGGGSSGSLHESDTERAYGGKSVDAGGNGKGEEEEEEDEDEDEDDEEDYVFLRGEAAAAAVAMAQRSASSSAVLSSARRKEEAETELAALMSNSAAEVDMDVGENDLDTANNTDANKFGSRRTTAATIFTNSSSEGGLGSNAAAAPIHTTTDTTGLSATANLGAHGNKGGVPEPPQPEEELPEITMPPVVKPPLTWEINLASLSSMGSAPNGVKGGRDTSGGGGGGIKSKGPPLSVKLMAPSPAAVEDGSVSQHQQQLRRGSGPGGSGGQARGGASPPACNDVFGAGDQQNQSVMWLKPSRSSRSSSNNRSSRYGVFNALTKHTYNIQHTYTHTHIYTYAQTHIHYI